jgi:hypothetical protein
VEVSAVIQMLLLYVHNLWPTRYPPSPFRTPRARAHCPIFGLDNRSTQGAPLPHVNFAPPRVSFHIIISYPVDYWSTASRFIPARRIGLLLSPSGIISQHCVIPIAQYYMQHTDTFDPPHPTAFRASISSRF